MHPSSLRLAPWSELAIAFARALGQAHDFADVGLATCAASRAYGLDCQITLVSSRGQHLVTVEHVTAVEKLFAHTLPIHALIEPIGVIRWRAERQVDGELGGELATVAIVVALRLAQLGYTSCLDDVDGLTMRQAETASLAARGHTNTEIGDLLGVSENTVKKHLRDVFGRLHIASRTELALRFARLATVDIVAAGVRRVGDCQVTRHVTNLPR